MQLKQISAEGHTSYLVYSSDTFYREAERQQIKQDSNYFSTLKYRQKFTDVFDREWYSRVFGFKIGKVRGVWL